MLLSMLTIFLPLVIGYCLKLSDKNWLNRINFMVSKLINFILILMGLSIAKLDNLSHNLSQVLTLSVTFFTCISLANLFSLFWLDKRLSIETQSKQTKIPLLTMAKESLTLMFVILTGLLLGLLIPFKFPWLDSVSEKTLQILLFLIGIQLRNSGMTLKQIIVNVKGLSVAATIVISSLLGGAIAAKILNIPINHGLAMASGFGWYSLAGILMKDALGPIYGGASFLLELARELVAIILIPLFINRKPLTAIGYGGATSMDFTLPIIQTTGGLHCVPIAIVSGFVLSLLVPILMLFFISL